jgi:RNA recognition motif-containing protein
MKWLAIKEIVRAVIRFYETVVHKEYSLVSNNVFIRRTELFPCFYLQKKYYLTRKKRKKEIRMQGSKLYVGNLNYSVTNEELEELFSNYGEVKEVNIIEGRGFGFVEMSTPPEAEEAKEALNGSDLKGRTLKIDEARPPRGRQRGEGRPPRGRQRDENRRPRGRQGRDSRRY